MGAPVDERFASIPQPPPAPRVDMNPLTNVPYTPRFYQLLDKRQRLPVWAAREEFLKLMAVHQVVVLVGETGSGKTTQLPQILLDAGYHVQNGQIKSLACTQPHDLATTVAASRVGEELEVGVGTFVGQVLRFEDRSSPDTLLKFLTDEALLREVMMDSLLEKYSVIVVDEAHERSLATDLLLAILKLVIVRRPELKLVIMGASREVQTVQAFFEGAPLVAVPLRTSPVQCLYIEDVDRDYLKLAMRTILQIHQKEQEGDILLFVTTEDEADFICATLRKDALRLMEFGEMVLYPLYPGLPQQQWQKAFDPAPAPRVMGGKPGRKVVVSTNIAESSVAIDNIAFVIDCGLARQRVYNPRTRMECQMVMPISRPCTSNRAVLAGRLKAGKCFRLYPEKSVALLTDRLYPEIMRSNLLTAVLMLKRLGITDLVRFEFIDPPPPEAMMRALESLYFLKCIDESAELTDLGHQVCFFPVEPQLAKMLLESPKHRCSNEALSIAAMLCVLPVFVRPIEARRAAEEAKSRFAHLDGDHLTHLNVFHAYKQQMQEGIEPIKFCAENFISLRAMRASEVIRDQLKGVMMRLGLPLLSTDFQDKEYYPNIRRCLVSGFFLQAAVLDSEKRGTYLTLREGQEVTLHPTTSLQSKPEWIVFHEVAITSRTYIRYATGIRPEWLLELAGSYHDPQRIPLKSPARAKLEKVQSLFKQAQEEPIASD